MAEDDSGKKNLIITQLKISVNSVFISDLHDLCELINMKYAIFVFYQGNSTQLTWKDGLWYAALISSGHTISAEFLKDVHHSLVLKLH